MHLRDASGRRVSILNEGDNDDYESGYQKVALSQYYSGQQSGATSASGFPHSQAYYAYDAPSLSNAPELSRSDSFDSQVSYGPASPLTPSSAQHDYTGVYATPDGQSPFYGYQLDDHRSYSEAKKDAAGGKESSSERKGKRYPCRYAEELGCDKTFTTSGHASRHAKIHFAVRTVPCTFENCPKMFTRSDNMKQHLETHYKRGGDKGQRSAASGRGSGSHSKGRSASRHQDSEASFTHEEDSEGLSHSEFELPMRPSHGRRLGSTESGLSIASNPLDTLVYAAQQARDM